MDLKNQTLEFQHLSRLKQSLIEEHHFIKSQFENQISLLKLRFRLQLHSCQTDFELNQFHFRYQAEALFYKLKSRGISIPDNLLSHQSDNFRINIIYDSNLNVYTIDKSNKNDQLVDILDIDPNLYSLKSELIPLPKSNLKHEKLRTRISGHVQNAFGSLDVKVSNETQRNVIDSLSDKLVEEFVKLEPQSNLSLNTDLRKNQANKEHKSPKSSIKEILNPVEDNDTPRRTKIPLSSILSNSEGEPTSPSSMLKISSVLNIEQNQQIDDDYYTSSSGSEIEDESNEEYDDLYSEEEEDLDELDFEEDQRAEKTRKSQRLRSSLSSRGSKSSRDSKGSSDWKSSRDSKTSGSRDSEDPKELKEITELRDARDLRESKESGETRDPKGSKDSRHYKESRSSKESSNSKGSRESRESRHSRESSVESVRLDEELPQSEIDSPKSGSQPDVLNLLALIPKKLKKKSRKDPTKYNSANLLKKDPLDLRTCPICERKFYRIEHLKRHLTSVHNEEKPFPCETCGKHFTRKDNLHQHQRRKHGLQSNEKNEKNEKNDKDYIDDYNAGENDENENNKKIDNDNDNDAVSFSTNSKYHHGPDDNIQSHSPKIKEEVLNDENEK